MVRTDGTNRRLWANVGSCERCPGSGGLGRVLGGEQNLGDAINATLDQGWEFVSASYAIDQLGFAVMKREKK